jgi:ABC-type uncharacterized transport system permease subunit
MAEPAATGPLPTRLAPVPRSRGVQLLRHVAHLLFTATVRPVLGPLVAVVLALAVGAVLIIAAGESPLKAYKALILGAIGTGPGIMRTLRWFTPLVISGLAASVAFRGGMFNIGVEGCLWVGGLATTLVGIYATGLPSIIHIPLALAAGVVVGALWTFAPALARAKYQVDEVVFTLMLNYIATLIVIYLIRYYFLDQGIAGVTFSDPRTPYIQPSAELPWINATYELSIAPFIALILVVIFHYLFRHSIWGYETEVTGLNALFARFGGVKVVPVALWAMLVSGALGGLVGGMEVVGTYHKFFARFSVGTGFDGIAVALMGKLSPWGVLFSSIFFSILKEGGASMERGVNVSRNIVTVIQALVIFFVTAERFYEFLRLKRRARAEE